MPINSKNKANEIVQKRTILDGRRTTEIAMDINYSICIYQYFVFFEALEAVTKGKKYKNTEFVG